MKTKAVNSRMSHYDVYIGRGSPFGNPFIGRHIASIYPECIRSDDPIEDFTRWLRGEIVAPGWTTPTRKQIRDLKGKRLGCFCKPKPCHGDVLARMAEEG